MPKMKTRRAAAKRFKTTGTGKLMKMNANTSHILNKKTAKRKRHLRKAVEVDASNVKMMKRCLPYVK
ncbi:MAG: 50S ribosomal protein L35 [Clostridiaceae bacterium]|nr:50S ribosomal protein L35 [Clostridiaceae bacterium]